MDNLASWWELTEEQQQRRMAIEPLTPGAVSETFRHPVSYAELRLVKTVWKYADELVAAKKRITTLEEALGHCSRLAHCDCPSFDPPIPEDHYPAEIAIRADAALAGTEPDLSVFKNATPLPGDDTTERR